MLKKYILTCLGNPLMDIIAQAPVTLLEKYQLKLDNCVLANERHKGLYEEILQLNPLFVPGGSALNTARVASWMLRQSFPVGFIGSLGNDNHADLLTQLAIREEVEIIAEKHASATGHCLVLVNNKDRSLVTNPGASRTFTDSSLNRVWPVLANSRMIYFEGFFLRSSEAALDRVIEFSVEHKVPIGVNLSSLPIISDYLPFFQRQLPHFNYIFCNEGEALEFASKIGIAQVSVEEVARQLARVQQARDMPRVVVVTRGHKPVVVATPNRVFSVEVPLLDESKIVDKNGAGDAFAGGFLAAAVSGCNIEKCTDAGLYASNDIIQASGCQLVRDTTFSLSFS